MLLRGGETRRGETLGHAGPAETSHLASARSPDDQDTNLSGSHAHRFTHSVERCLVYRAATPEAKPGAMLKLKPSDWKDLLSD